MSEKIKVTGSPGIEDHPRFGERVTLIVYGAFDRRAQTYTEGGEVRETLTFTVEEVATPGESLIEAAYDRIVAARERREGRSPLPLEAVVEKFVDTMDAVAGEGNWSVEAVER